MDRSDGEMWYGRKCNAAASPVSVKCFPCIAQLRDGDLNQMRQHVYQVQQKGILSQHMLK